MNLRNSYSLFALSDVVIHNGRLRFALLKAFILISYFKIIYYTWLKRDAQSITGVLFEPCIPESQLKYLPLYGRVTASMGYRVTAVVEDLNSDISKLILFSKVNVQLVIFACYSKN